MLADILFKVTFWMQKEQNKWVEGGDLLRK